MTVIQMSGQELAWLRVMIEVVDGRRKVFRLRRAFDANGSAELTSRNRGRPSHRQYGETFRRLDVTRTASDTRFRRFPAPPARAASAPRPRHRAAPATSPARPARRC